MADEPERSSTPPSTSAPSATHLFHDGEISLLDLLIIFAKHKRMITQATIGAAILSTIVCLFLPNIYTGTTKVLPPQQGQSTVSMLLGQLGGLAGLADSSFDVRNLTRLYVGMLKSRTIADKIIRRFDLAKVYDMNTMVETRKEFADNSSITAGKDGLITIAFDDEDPKRAAGVANAYVEELNKLTQSLAVTDAGQRRLFFERQLQGAKEDLKKAEVALKATQEKTGLIALDAQGKAIIEAGAILSGQISGKEVELRAIRTFATESSPEYIRAQQQLAGLRSELNKLKRTQTSEGGDILLPTAKVPAAALEYLRKFRDVKYYETIFEFLAKQLEAAKIDEAQDSTIVQVVDRAIVPDHKSKPMRALIVIATSLIAALLAYLWAFVLETKARASEDPVQAARLAELRRYTSFRQARSNSRE
jgi:uncharacterized protein involved in exopolysaccharide biosynthesis